MANYTSNYDDTHFSGKFTPTPPNSFTRIPEGSFIPTPEGSFTPCTNKIEPVPEGSFIPCTRFFGQKKSVLNLRTFH